MRARGTAARRRADAMVPVAVLGLGLVSLVLLLAMNHLRERLLAEDLAVLRATDEIEASVALAHLWMEEYLGGVEVSTEELDGNLERSETLAQAMRGSDGEVRVLFAIEPPREPDLAERIARLSERLDEFAAFSEWRREAHARGEEVGLGSTVDLAYDQLFRDLARQADELRRVIEPRVEASESRVRLLTRSLLAGWALLVALAFVGLQSRERRRRQAEAALAEREAELTRAQKLEAVGRLASGIAHDINNYLATMTARCELVKREPGVPAPTAEEMDAIMATASRASGLLDRLLPFGRRVVAPRAISLSSLIVELDDLLRRILGEKIDLDVRLSEPPALVEGDPAELERILVNLLVNCREALVDGGNVRVETERVLWREDDPERPATLPVGEYAMLAVSDDGPGIPVEIRDRIFEPFFTSKADSPGSGLGLTTVYAIVRQHGGDLRVGDRRGGPGSRIEIFFPLAAAGEAAAGRPAGEIGGGERILLVDDNEDFRVSTERLLTSLGYRVTAAADGPSALVAVSGAEALDLVITDVVMPGMSGPELVDQLRRRLGQIPAVFVTGYGEREMSRAEVHRRSARLVRKPVGLEALARAVRSLLDIPRTL